MIAILSIINERRFKKKKKKKLAVKERLFFSRPFVSFTDNFPPVRGTRLLSHTEKNQEKRVFL